MTKLAKMKPCPFCGSTDAFVECMDFGDFAVRCNNCIGTGPHAEGCDCDPSAENHRGARNAIREWNKRKRPIPTDAGRLALADKTSPPLSPVARAGKEQP